jgi:chaperonin GroES
MKQSIKPIGSKILIKPLGSEEVHKSGIIIPETAQEKPHEGTIVSLGSGGTDENGNKIEFTVKEGDHVIYSKYGGAEIKLEGESFLIMREEELLAVISQ